MVTFLLYVCKNSQILPVIMGDYTNKPQNHPELYFHFIKQFAEIEGSITRWVFIQETVLKCIIKKHYAMS